MRNGMLAAAAATSLVCGPASAATARYTLNKDHTDVVFQISHVGFSNKHGWFRDIAGTLDLDADRPETSAISVTINAASIDTNHARRDQDLTGASFLNVATFPRITFVSTQVRRTGADTADVIGDLTLHGVTRRLVLHARLNRMAPNPFDHTPTAGFTAEGVLKRSDYGVAALVPTIGDEVSIVIDAEFSGAKP